MSLTPFELNDCGLTVQAGEQPVGFKIAVENFFFSLVDDSEFLNKTALLEVPFEVYDGLAREFITTPPLVYWHYPSSTNPF